MKFKNLILSSLVLVTGLLMVGKAQAAEFSAQSLSLTSSRPGVEASYTFQFTHTSAATVRYFTFDFCELPSGAGDTCGDPIDTGDVAGAARGTLNNLGTATDWGITVNAKKITLFNNTAAMVINDGTVVSIQLTGIDNTTLDEDCDDAATDTCYVWVQSHADNDAILDRGVVTYTIVEEVLVTAKVDPTFTFVVSPVGSNTATNGVTTTVGSSATTLPFGSLQPGTPRYAAHYLYVTTNTVGGYTVSATMVTPLTGIVGTNNIDPYQSPWTAPTLWTQPTGGGANVNTGWFGGNTNDTDVANWTSGTAGKFGGISDTAVQVMRATGSDNGTTPATVTYALGVNVFQPSDYYTGYLVYNALPNY